MGAIASQITSLTIVYSTVYSDADQRKHKSKLRVTGLLWGEFTGDRWIPAEKASDAENVSIWWRHHGPPYRRLGSYLAEPSDKCENEFYGCRMWTWKVSIINTWKSYFIRFKNTNSLSPAQRTYWGIQWCKICLGNVIIRLRASLKWGPGWEHVIEVSIDYNLWNMFMVHIYYCFTFCVEATILQIPHGFMWFHFSHFGWCKYW